MSKDTTNTSRPNIVVVLTDDQGFGQLPVYTDLFRQHVRHLVEPTTRYRADIDRALEAAERCMPHLQQRAAEGVRMTEAHVSSPVCGPSRASLMSGRYHQRFGVYGNQDADQGLPVSETCLPELLQGAGYRNAMIGKWHLGRRSHVSLPVDTRDYHRSRIEQCEPKHHPLNRGFDYYYGFNGTGTCYYDSPSIHRGFEQVKHPGFLTDDLTEEAVGFIEAEEQQPFFLYLAYNAPHIPLEDPAPPEYLDRFDTGNPEVDNYYAYLAAVDDGIGRLVDSLEKSGRLEKTLFFYLSDNGAVIDSPWPANGPFRGFKGQLLQGGMHVPMIVSWPDGLPRGAAFEDMVSAMDVLPTALAAAGVEVPGGLKLDGRNLLPRLRGVTDSPPHERLFWAGPDSLHWGEENRAFWEHYWDYLEERRNDTPKSELVEPFSPPAWSVRQGPWLLQCRGDEAPSLCRVDDDPGERSDLSGQHGDTVADMTQAFRVWMNEMKEPVRWERAKWQRLKDA